MSNLAQCNSKKFTRETGEVRSDLSLKKEANPITPSRK